MNIIQMRGDGEHFDLRQAEQRAASLMDDLVIRSRAYSDELKHAAIAMENATWSKFGYLNYTQPHRKYYDELLETFDDFQLCLVDVATNLPVALVNCVPVSCRESLNALPEEGWDWLVETGGTAHGEDIRRSEHGDNRISQSAAPAR
jgi:hypothetical protein